MLIRVTSFQNTAGLTPLVVRQVRASIQGGK
jgi:hypothetical protein